MHCINMYCFLFSSYGCKQIQFQQNNLVLGLIGRQENPDENDPNVNFKATTQLSHSQIIWVF